MIKKLNNIELIKLFSDVIKELKNRKIIRTNNIIGDIGERLAIDFYSNSDILPNLTDTPTSTEDYDAISENKNRYSIKSLSSKTTGTFHGIPKKYSNQPISKKFEYLIIVKFSKDYELEKIIELTWKQFLEFKGWHSTMNAWNITLSKKLLNNSKIIFDIEKENKLFKI